MLNVWNISTYIWHKFMVNSGKYSIHGAHGIYLSHVFHHFSSFLTTRHPTWRIIPGFVSGFPNHGDRFRPKDLGLLNTPNIYGLFVGLFSGGGPSHLEVLPMHLPSARAPPIDEERPRTARQGGVRDG